MKMRVSRHRNSGLTDPQRQPNGTVSLLSLSPVSGNGTRLDVRLSHLGPHAPPLGLKGAGGGLTHLLIKDIRNCRGKDEAGFLLMCGFFFYSV